MTKLWIENRTKIFFWDSHHLHTSCFCESHVALREGMFSGGFPPRAVPRNSWICIHMHAYYSYRYLYVVGVVGPVINVFAKPYWFNKLSISIVRIVTCGGWTSSTRTSPRERAALVTFSRQSPRGCLEQLTVRIFLGSLNTVSNISCRNLAVLNTCYNDTKNDRSNSGVVEG